MTWARASVVARGEAAKAGEAIAATVTAATKVFMIRLNI
jgi:hypothetical protein